MKQEQEIVLQKKMILIFSLGILVIITGVLNIQKTQIKLAKLNWEDTKCINPVYTAKAESFLNLESGETKVETVEKEEVENKSNVIIEEEKIEEKLDEALENKEIKVASTKAPSETVASRGGFVRDTEGVPTDYVDVLEVKATAYCLCKKCCGKTPDNPRYGYTASGLRIIPGNGMKVIAVDTSVIKLGTNVYVEGLNGAKNYGYAVAADTGSAIKNHKIDLYMDTHEEALRWGVKNVKVYILPD